MPSPFPGMDPFLEGPTEWAGVHSRLINAISDDLADRLAPHFIVNIYALLKRGQRDVPFEVRHIDLHDRLPTIAVPLRSPLADVPLDLQAAFDRVYARGHYAESVDYTGRIPSPPLRPADAAWAAGRVRDWLAARQAGQG